MKKRRADDENKGEEEKQKAMATRKATRQHNATQRDRARNAKERAQRAKTKEKERQSERVNELKRAETGGKMRAKGMART